MSFNTNRQARQLRKHLGLPRQYTHSPWQWGYVAAAHAPRTTTLSAPCPAGADVISVAASIEPNALIVVGSGGPVEVESVTGAGPFTLTLATRGVPFAQSSGATVRVIATVDLYLDGWQNPPGNLPSGVVKTLTTGVRYLQNYVPQVGHVVLVSRGTGLQRSDRIVLGAPGAQSPAWISVQGGVGYQPGWADRTFSGIFHGAQYRKVGDIVYLRGLVVRAAGTNQPIFDLPVGYLPTKQGTFIADAGGAFGEVQVTPAGVVLCTIGTVTNYLSLDGVSFSTT